MSGNVHQSDKTKLKATVDVAADQAIEVTQADAAKLKGTVTQAAKDRTVTNATAANLKAEVTQAEKDRTVTGTVTAAQTDAGNLKVQAYQQAENPYKVVQDTAASLKCEPTQNTASNLKVEAYQQLEEAYRVDQTAKDRTVTNATASNLKCEPTQTTAANLKATVTPSGDMARKAHYDRNPTNVSQYYAGELGVHNWTSRFSYTVPEGRKALCSLLFMEGYTAIATAGKVVDIKYEVTPDGGSAKRVAFLAHYSTTAPVTAQTVTAIIYLFEGDKLEAFTDSSDTIDHWILTGCSMFEYDE